MSESPEIEPVENSDLEDVSDDNVSDSDVDMDGNLDLDDSEDDLAVEKAARPIDLDARIERLGKLYEEANNTDDEEEDDASLGSLEEDEVEGLQDDAERFYARQTRKQTGELKELNKRRDEQMRDLERLVFGDPDAVKAGLKNFDINDETTGTTGMEGVANADLFFVDDDGDANAAILAGNPVDDEPAALPAAWEDSEDERLTIDLNEVRRLRKLRTIEDERPLNGIEYSRRLRQHFELLHPRPQWAVEATEGPAAKKRRLSQESDSEDDTRQAPPLSKLIRSANSLTRTVTKGRSRTVRPEVINIQRCPDVPGRQLSTVTCLNFHPTYPILLSSGPSATVYMHHITPSPPAPSPNPLLISLQIRGSPLHTTSFTPNDSRIFMSAKERHFHVWDLDTGKVEKVQQFSDKHRGHEQLTYAGFKISPNGKHIALQGGRKYDRNIINIISSGSMQKLAEVRVESRKGIVDFHWWSNSEGITVLERNGEITEWSMASRKVIARWQDEGAVQSTVMAFGGRHNADSPIGNDRWLAVGSAAGIVNIYDRKAMLSEKHTADQCISETPKPLRALDHITTVITSIVFSPDGQIMAMASAAATDSLRLVHLPSATVFRNWPTDTTPLGRVTAIAFGSGEMLAGGAHSTLAVANKKGQVKLWQIY